MASIQKHPKGLYLLFTVEMWERFNYYGMRAILALFMTSSVIGFAKSTSSQIYGWFTALVYLTPLIGGYLADKYIGKRHSVIIGALVMMVGQFTLASYDLIPAKLALLLGLTFIIIGNGFFKPNISSIVGELYEQNDNRRDSAFTIFYMGINLGAFIAPFVCGYLGQAIAWKYGFMAAGAGMMLGLLTYLLLQKRFLGDVGSKPVPSTNLTKEQEQEKNKPLTKEEKDKIKAIFAFTFFAVFFFAFFEQAGTSLTFFADEATRLPVINLFGITSFQIRSSFFQAINPVFILLLAPVFQPMEKLGGTIHTRQIRLGLVFTRYCICHHCRWRKRLFENRPGQHALVGYDVLLLYDRRTVPFTHRIIHGDQTSPHEVHVHVDGRLVDVQLLR